MVRKTSYYWDACIFYEWLGNEQVSAQKKAAIDEIPQANENEENIIVTSVITHLEVLPGKLGDKGANDEADYLALFDAKRFHEVEISANILLRAREIRDYYYVAANESGSGGKMMDLGDCIHLATASISGASEFHTRDNDGKGAKVPILKLYDPPRSPRLCGKYDLLLVSPESPQGAFDGI